MIQQSSYRHFITRVVLFSFLFQQGFTTALWAGKYDEIAQTRQVVTHKLHHVRPQDPSQSNTSGDLVIDLEKRTLSVVLNDGRERGIAPELRPQLPWEISREGMTRYLAAHHWTATELECGNFN